VVIVRRRGSPDVALVPAEELAGLMETAHLLQSPANVFQPEFRQDLRWWVETNQSTALRILVLVEAVLADPLQGIGKPQPLSIR